MKKNEFINLLKQALKGEVSHKEIMDSCEYYSGYIDRQVQNGKTEEEVTAELGHPSILAKSIIASSKKKSMDVEMEEVGTQQGKEENKEKKPFRFDFFSWYAKLLYLLIFIVLVVIVFFIIKLGIIILITFGIPILLILGIVYLIMYLLK